MQLGAGAARRTSKDTKALWEVPAICGQSESAALLVLDFESSSSVVARQRGPAGFKQPAGFMQDIRMSIQYCR